MTMTHEVVARVRHGRYGCSCGYVPLHSRTVGGSLAMVEHHIDSKLPEFDIDMELLDDAKERGYSLDWA